MAGHSHWARIRHKKAVVDARRGQAWSKLARGVTITAKMGGGNPNDNPRLRLAIDKARAANMPKETIEKAIKKGTGELAGEAYEDVLYEGYAPSGVAIMCQAVTNNRNRTGGEIRRIFERCGGSLGPSNCVAFLFKQKGIIVVDAAKATEDRVMELALEAEADDVQHSGTAYQITCPPAALEQIKRALTENGVPIESAELAMVADNEVTLDADGARKIMKLVDTLEEHDDVDAVYSNSDIPDEIVAQLAANS